MEPLVYPLAMNLGADFHKEFTIKDDDGVLLPLAGGDAEMTITSEEPDPDAELTLSTAGGADGTITLSNTAPNVIFDLPESAVTGDWFNGNYDFYLTPPGGTKERYLEGDFNIRPRVI